jgi:3alpha(or 20beta)-hydroxysteroid dehydrogenase
MEGAVAIVTGCAYPNGIGASSARRLAEEGARVLMTDLLGEDGKRTAEGLRESGLDVQFCEHDVTSEGAWAAVVDTCGSLFGAPNVLLNNAGVFRGETILDETLDGWERTIASNLTSVFLGMRTVIPAMAAAGGGSIVNISSIWGVVGAAGAAAYQASKGGVTVLTKHAAVAHVDDHIRVNSIHPGGVDTVIMERSGAANAANVAEATPMGRLARADEIADCVVFLASSRSSYVTGATFMVDGGFSAV